MALGVLDNEAKIQVPDGLREIPGARNIPMLLEALLAANGENAEPTGANFQALKNGIVDETLFSRFDHLIAVLENFDPAEYDNLFKLQFLATQSSQLLIKEGLIDEFFDMIAQYLDELDKAEDRRVGWVLRATETFVEIGRADLAEKLCELVTEKTTYPKGNISRVLDKANGQKKPREIIKDTLRRVQATMRMMDFDGARKLITDIRSQFAGPGFDLKNVKKWEAFIDSFESVRDTSTEEIYERLLTGKFPKQDAYLLFKTLSLLYPNDYYSLMGLFYCAREAGNLADGDVALAKLSQTHADKPDVCLLIADNLIAIAKRTTTKGQRGGRKRKPIDVRLARYSEACGILAKRAMESGEECGIDMEALKRIKAMQSDGFDPYPHEQMKNLSITDPLQEAFRLVSLGNLAEARGKACKLLATQNPKNAVSIYKLLFEISFLEKDFEAAHTAFEYLRQKLHSTEIVPFRAQLIILQETPRGEQHCGHSSNGRFWSSVATSEPVNCTAKSVAGPQSSQPKGRPIEDPSKDVVVGNGFVRRRPRKT
jgi:hypothetical protein